MGGVHCLGPGPKKTFLTPYLRELLAIKGDEKTKRQKDKKTKTTKREFDIVMSGQSHTFAMFLCCQRRLEVESDVSVKDLV